MKLYEIVFGLAATSVVGAVLGTFAHSCFEQINAHFSTLIASAH